MPFVWPSKSDTPSDRDSSPGDDDHASSSSSSSSKIISTFSTLPSNSLRTAVEENATVSESSWTRIFPDAYRGIRKAIDDSPFRWCVRESSLWAVATGTVMGM